MDRYQSLRYEMFLRVREFGHAHRQLFPASSTAHTSFAALAAAVDRIKTHTTAATLTAAEGRKTKKMLREAINDRLIAIVRTSRELSTEHLDVTFRLPAKGSDARLLATAQAFIRDCQAVKDQFVALDLPDNFDTELQQLVDRFEEVAGGRRAGKARVKTANLGLQAAMADAYRVIRRLDVVVANRLKDDPVLLAVWKTERRVTGHGSATPVPTSEGPTPLVSEPALVPTPVPVPAPVPPVDDDGLRRAS